MPLAPLGRIAKPKLAGFFRKLKARLAQIMPQSAEKKLRTATYILMGLKYEKAFIDQVMEGMMNMKESVTYQAILREGMEEGIEQGREEGRQEGEIFGERAVILRQGENGSERRLKLQLRFSMP